MTSGYKDGTPEEVRITTILPRKSFIFDANSLCNLLLKHFLGFIMEAVCWHLLTGMYLFGKPPLFTLCTLCANTN